MIIALALHALASPGHEHTVVSDDVAIYDHLATVEERLRAADVSHLDPTRQQRRSELLDVLHDYRMAGVFPHNHQGIERDRPVHVDGVFPIDQGRTPVFVDEHGTHCAVGYLLAVDGQDELVSRIVQGGNLRFVHEIDDPELLAWAGSVGLSREDLARIQPSYGGEDQDRDGWVIPDDCNDDDDTIHPDAEEICDQIDNNCDGEVDEGDVCVVDDTDDPVDDPIIDDEPAYCSATGGLASWPLALLALPLLLRRRRT